MKSKKEKSLDEIEKFNGFWEEFIWGVRKDTKIADKSLKKIINYWKKLK